MYNTNDIKKTKVQILTHDEGQIMKQTVPFFPLFTNSYNNNYTMKNISVCYKTSSNCTGFYFFIFYFFVNCQREQARLYTTVPGAEWPQCGQTMIRWGEGGEGRWSFLAAFLHYWSFLSDTLL